MIKYTVPYRSADDVAWKIDISTEAYEGEPITVKGVQKQACSIEYSPREVDDPFTTIIDSTASINLYNQGQIDIEELQNAQDKEFVVAVYKNDVLEWKGYMIPDGIQQAFKAPPYDVQINATDGLTLLDKLTYTHNNLTGVVDGSTRCPMNYIRQILFSANNLGIPLPIHWANELECLAFPDEDMFAGNVTWSARGEGFNPFQDNASNKSCLYVLEGILKSAQCRIVQSKGKWILRRIPDIVDGTFTDKSIPADFDPLVVTTEDIDVNKVIGVTGYPFILEDHVFLVKKGIKACKVTYEAYIRENIIPNGNQDIDIFGVPLYWYIVGGSGSYASVPGIDGRAGLATELTNSVGGDPYEQFTLVNVAGDGYEGLPVDTYTLVKRVNFGFVFSPQLGFTYDSGTGIIDYDNDPMQVKVEYYRAGTDLLYLDQFGIWRTDETWISIKVAGTKINDIIQIDFNRNNAVILPKPPDEADHTQEYKIFVLFKIKDGQQYTIDYIHMGIDENFDVFESEYSISENTDTEERTLTISSSFGGYMLSNYMTSWHRSNLECDYTDGIYTGTLTGMTANAIMRYMYKSSKIYNGSMNVRGKDWSFDEIYTIDTLSGIKFLPLNATYNTETSIVSLVAIECRNDDIFLTEKHYGSNDNQLSN